MSDAVAALPGPGECRGPALLVLMRHAESARNIAKEDNRFFQDATARVLVQGIADWQIPLTPDGHRQALVAGRALRERFGTFDVVCHSGYRRAEETVRGLLEAYPPADRERMAVERHPFVRERDAGYTYDMTSAEADAAFPWLEAHWTTHGPWFSRPPGGESLADVANRVGAFLATMCPARVDGRVLVVTHGGTLRAFRSLLETWTLEATSRDLAAYLIPNCGATVYRRDPATSRLSLADVNLALAASTASS